MRSAKRVWKYGSFIAGLLLSAPVGTDKDGPPGRLGGTATTIETAIFNASGGAHRGEDHAHRGAVPQRALDPEPPVVRLDDVLHDRQAQPGAAQPARARPADPEESLRQTGQVLAGDADAGVRDRELDGGRTGEGPAPDVDLHAAALGRVLDGVVDQVDEDLPHAIAVRI